MFLFIGTLFLAAGLIWVLNSFIYKKLPKNISYIITLVIGIGFLITGTVHGIWLGLTIIIIGLLWLRINSWRHMQNKFK